MAKICRTSKKKVEKQMWDIDNITKVQIEPLVLNIDNDTSSDESEWIHKYL